MPKKECTGEFKKQSVKRAQEEVGVGVAAQELVLLEQTWRNWVKLAAAGLVNAAGAKPVTS